jgi:iron complex transport system permease protein
MSRLGYICIFSILVLVIAPFIGGTSLSIAEVFSFSGGDAEIFWRIRLPRVLMAFIAGAVLSMSGMIFQALFRNPLATPYTLGIASGASLGAAIYFLLSTTFLISTQIGAPIFAFIGAFAAMALVYSLGWMLKGNSILLIGVALNFSFSSIIMFIQYMAGFESSHRLIRFMIGGLDSSTYLTIFITLPFLALGLAATLLYRRELDLIMTGEEVAASRGVNLTQMKYAFYIVTSLMIGCVVSVTGPIGFVGMMAPHICRLLVGTGHSRLIPASFFFGGAFLVACDSFARIVIFPTEIPVGVVTSMLGGPFFILLLMRGRK